MSAIKGNIVNNDRVDLGKVLPLESPFTVCIDPSNVCNFKCSFCAIQTDPRPVKFKKMFMTFDLFKKIVDDISEMPNPLKILRLNGMGEPLLNPYFCEMVKYAKEKKIAPYIETITNGSKFCPDFNDKIVDSGINRIRISIESINPEGYFEICKVKIDFDLFLNNIKDLHDKAKSKGVEIYIKTVDAAVDTAEKRKLFYNIFSPVCDRIFIDGVAPLWADFKLDEFRDRSTGMHGQELKFIKVCPFPFYSLVINSDGEVTACCADWERRLVLGDLKNESFKDIWNGNRFKMFLIDLLDGKKEKYEMCRKCLLPYYDCNDNIDDSANEIKNRILSL